MSELFSVYFPAEQVIYLTPSKVSFRFRIPLFVFWWLEKRGYQTGQYGISDINEQNVRVNIFYEPKNSQTN
jgi:hypothetical protein